MAQYYFHLVTEVNGAASVSLLEQPVVRRREGVRVETYPLLPVQNIDMEGGVATVMALGKWLGGKQLSSLLEAIFEQGYQAGKKSATTSPAETADFTRQAEIEDRQAYLEDLSEMW